MTSDGGVRELPLPEHRLPLGALLNGGYQLSHAPVGPGEVVLGYSDGVIEALSPAGEQFGDRRLAEVLAEGPCDPQAVVGRVLDAVRRFADGAEPYDDITLVAIARDRRRSHAQALDSGRCRAARRGGGRGLVLRDGRTALDDRFAAGARRLPARTSGPDEVLLRRRARRPSRRRWPPTPRSWWRSSRCSSTDGSKEERERLIAELRQSDTARLNDRERLMLDVVLARADHDEPRRARRVAEYLAEHPRDPWGLNLASADAWARQDWPEAEQLYRRLVEVDPNWLMARNHLGYIAMAQGRFAEAEEHFRIYKYVAPDQANPHDSLGELLILLGRYDEARAELEEAVRVRPDFCASYQNLLRDHGVRAPARGHRSRWSSGWSRTVRSRCTSRSAAPRSSAGPSCPATTTRPGATRPGPAPAG